MRFYLILFVLLHFCPVSNAQELIEAKIGIWIESGQNGLMAKHNQKLKAGDELRIYVVPASDAYIYVVHSDNKTVTLLTPEEQQEVTRKSSLFIFPGPDAFLQVDGSSKIEHLTIICSKRKLKEMATIHNSKSPPVENWALLREDLTRKSKIAAGDTTQLPPDLAGNVRAIDINEFLRQLPSYKGRSLLIKHTTFRVRTAN